MQVVVDFCIWNFVDAEILCQFKSIAIQKLQLVGYGKKKEFIQGLFLYKGVHA